VAICGEGLDTVPVRTS
jgi:hypothetical protein